MASVDILADNRPIYWSTIGRQSTDYWSKVDRHSTDSRLIVDQCITRYVHIYRSTVGRYIGQQSTDAWADMCTNFYRSTVGRYIGPLSADLSVDYRPIVGRLSTDSRQIYRPICRPRPPIVQMTRKFDSNLPTRQYPKNKKNRQIALSVSVWSFKNNRYLYVERSVWNSKILLYDSTTKQYSCLLYLVYCYKTLTLKQLFCLWKNCHKFGRTF